MIYRPLKRKASQAASFGLPPPSQSQFMWALIRKAYLDLTQDERRQQRFI